MKRSEILASPTVKEAGAGLLEWKLEVKAVMLSENTKLGREARKAIDHRTRFCGSSNKLLNFSWSVLPCSLYLMNPDFRPPKTQGPQDS